MAAPNEFPWIEAGYKTFALQGPDVLRVEQLARQVGISKSSFYHHFADLPVFVERLLAYHQQRAKAIAASARECRSFDPDFIQLLVANRADLLFQRQLRIRRDDQVFQRCFQQANTLVVEEIMPLWAETIGMPGRIDPAREMFTVVTDVFYQRLTNDNLTRAFVVEVLKEIEGFIRHSMNSRGSLSGLGGDQS